jgi:hypothetical protein
MSRLRLSGVLRSWVCLLAEQLWLQGRLVHALIGATGKASSLRRQRGAPATIIPWRLFRTGGSCEMHGSRAFFKYLCTTQAAPGDRPSTQRTELL